MLDSNLDSPTSQSTHTSLSILDAAVARFSPTAAIWMYDRSPPLETLISSLKTTLNSYQQWAGQLHWSKFMPEGGHTMRHGRLMLSYGSRPRSWQTQAPLALHDMIEYQGLPSMIVQLTNFSCGGIAISIKMAHPLADAQSLVQFANDWATVNGSLLTNTLCPVLSPIFDPQALDRTAAGDIDAASPDPEIIKLAHALPLHRYDWWDSANDCPPPLAAATQVPPEISLDMVRSHGEPLRWENWDMTSPVSHHVVHFNTLELQLMWEEASSFDRISHLDALLAHVWALIICARDLADDEENYLDVTFGFRSRLNPPLPETFLGSPLTLARVPSTGLQGSKHAIGALAASIRSTLSQFNSETLSALLHEMAHDASSQRIWNGFLGRQNTIVTSWLSLGIYDINFGTGPPMHVNPTMPSADGCVQVMEARNVPRERTKGGKWYEDGVSVSLHLKADVMQRLLGNPRLRKYRHA
ncbi:hypothetical protein K439DRAFT_1654977 [Ramaria rubella]|nr:hypothetical protein K439DRAFT_1654977 [Ramaria rubella]